MFFALAHDLYREAAAHPGSRAGFFGIMRRAAD
jgi:hypothetical protein